MLCFESIQWGLRVTEFLPAENPEALARQYGRNVFMAAYRVLGNAALAEDVQQDVFLRLVEKWPQAVDSWPAYLTTAATRAAIDVLRRRQRWGRVIELWVLQHATSADSTEQSGIEQERALRLRTALGWLPRRQALCFAMRYLLGQDIGAIARTLGLSENNINVILHRARNRLEAVLREPDKEPRR